jgi:hypothetical protein
MWGRPKPTPGCSAEEEEEDGHFEDYVKWKRYGYLGNNGTYAELKSTVLWDITPCSPSKVDRRFGGKYRLHLQGRRIDRARNQVASRARGTRRYIFITTAVRTSNPTHGSTGNSYDKTGSSARLCNIVMKCIHKVEVHTGERHWTCVQLEGRGGGGGR